MLALVGTLSAGPLAAFGLVFHAIDSDPETASLFSDAKWIGINRPFSWPNRTKVHPAPILRKTFVAGNAKAPVRLAVSAAGYYDVTLNGRPVTASMLNPTPSNYDVRSHYSVYDVSSLLVPGTNVVEAVLGRAYYDYPIDDLFMHSTITWRDSVSLLLQLSDAGGTVLAATDATWDAYPDGPVRFDCLRSGCTYDARKESLDERLWMKAAVKHGPGGRLVRESHPPVVVYARLPMREVSSGLWDSGQCMGGIAEISVRGERGAEITLVYREALDENGKPLDPEHYAEHFQTDRYTLRGEGVEKWRPQFTYHGFRYVAATVKGCAEIVAMDALAIGSGMMGEQDYAASKGLSHFVGQIGPDFHTEYETGLAMGEYYKTTKEVTKVGVYGAFIPNPMHVYRAAGVLAGLGCTYGGASDKDAIVGQIFGDQGIDMS